MSDRYSIEPTKPTEGEKRPLRVLTFTSLFPNEVSPDFGIFVAQRMETWARRHASRWSVVAPVPYFPKLPIATPWAAYAEVPSLEKRDGCLVLHPRYLMVPCVGMQLQGASMGRFSMDAATKLWAQEGPFDLVDAHFVYPDGYAAMLVARRLGVPFTVSARGTDINLYPDLPGIRKKITEVLLRAGAVIGVSRPLVQRMIALGAPEEHCHLAPNGVDLTAFRPPDAADGNRRVTRLLAIGHLVPEKGFDLLIEALSHLSPDFPEVKLTLVGSGPEEGALRALARRRGLNKAIHFAGEVPHAQLPAVYRETDALCLPSRREGCPNVVLEALASDLPVCATPVGGVPDLVADGRTGILAKEVSAQGIRDALEALVTRKWEANRMRSSVFGVSWERTAERLESIFRSVLRRSQSAVNSIASSFLAGWICSQMIFS